MTDRRRLILGIDTSNYKTSCALTDESGRILRDERRFLQVKEGERGLRQQNALFQHINALPAMVEDVLQGASADLAAVAVSTKPRPAEGSYMPCFLAGELAARAAASAKSIPLFTFSHQEGHVRAARRGTGLDPGAFTETGRPARFVSFHFSGGTTEAVLVDDSNPAGSFRVVGGSRDLAYGQAVDRLGVKLGLAFPCGEAMDPVAVRVRQELIQKNQGQNYDPDGLTMLTQIPVKDGYLNLSGIETQVEKAADTEEGELVIEALFREITRSMAKMTCDLAVRLDIRDFLLAGGITASSYVRENLKSMVRREIRRRRSRKRTLPDAELRLHFGEPSLSSDNAVGLALLGGDSLCRSDR